jgi:hypothetical protein
VPANARADGSGKPVRGCAATIAYHILKAPVEYRDLGADYFDKLHPGRLKKKLVKRLEGLGFQVTLEPRTLPA